jgi:hypothetical protein
MTTCCANSVRLLIYNLILINYDLILCDNYFIRSIQMAHSAPWMGQGIGSFIYKTDPLTLT